MEEGGEAGHHWQIERKKRIKTDFCKTPWQTEKKQLFVLLKNHKSTAVRKERWSPTSQGRKMGSRISLWSRAGCQTLLKAME